MPPILSVPPLIPKVMLPLKVLPLEELNESVPPPVFVNVPVPVTGPFQMVVKLVATSKELALETLSVRAE